MSASEGTIQSLSLEAPGAFLSGLLGVLDVQIITVRPDSIQTIPSAFGIWQLLAPVQSSLRIAAGDLSLHLTSGQAVAFTGLEELTLLSAEKGSLLRIVLCGSVADSVFSECRRQSGLFFPRGGEVAERMHHLLSARSRRQISAREASEDAYQLLMALYGTGSQTSADLRSLPLVVEAALGIIRRDYAFLDGISELANRLEVSQEYLTRCFCKYTGITPGKYLTQVRIENAKLLLESGKHKIQFVSDACGFSNANYFARVFRDSVGVSPREYARMHSAAEETRTREDPKHEDRLYVL